MIADILQGVGIWAIGYVCLSLGLVALSKWLGIR